MKVALLLSLLGLGLVASVLGATGPKVRYDNYKVYRFVPQTEADRQVLLDLQANNPGVIFWKGVKHVGQFVDIMFPPHLQMDIAESMVRTKSMGGSVLIEDVQQLIEEEAKGMLMEGKALEDWNAYGTLADIYKFLDDQAAASGGLAEVISIGESSEGRELKVIKISKSGETKPAIWYDSTIHAREWISGATCTYLVYQLLNNQDPAIQKMTDDFDWYIMCVANPDGFVYTQTDRMWRKTRSETSSPFGCKGADPNRNWDYEFDTGGSSDLPCDDTYHGASGFSEPETKAMSDFYNTIADRAVAFLSIHSYSQLILLPYGYSNDRYPDYQEYMRIGQAAADALAQKYRTQFTVGNIVDLLYVSSGGSVDWVKGVHDTSLVLAMELRDTGTYGFILPPNQILPSSEELLDAILEIAQQLRVRVGIESPVIAKSAPELFSVQAKQVA